MGKIKKDSTKEKCTKCNGTGIIIKRPGFLVFTSFMFPKNEEDMGVDLCKEYTCPKCKGTGLKT